MLSAGFTSPRPDRPDGDGPWRPSRRAWLVTGVCFLGGTTIGVVLSGVGSAGAGARELSEFEKAQLETVRWVREIAADPSRIGELRGHYHGLIVALHVMPDDLVLWDGFRQLVEYLEHEPGDVPAVQLARTLFQELSYYRPPLPDLESMLRRLEEMARR
ncbi:MAG: hypothetical protein AB7O97_04440 [Planctomycetota bacterium]